MSLWIFLQSHPWLFALWLGVFGLLLGSFFNVVILRWPARLHHQWQQDARQFLDLPPVEAPAPINLTTAHSRCPHCQHALAWWENIPLVSFALLRGKCRACKAPISWQYPVVEALAAALAVLAVGVLGVSVHTLAVVGVLWALLVLSFIDGQTQLLPDPLVYVVLWAGLLGAAFGVPGFVALPTAVLGAFGGYALLWSVFWLFKLIRGKEGLGHGDFKLLAALGAWCGLSGLWSIVAVAALAGAAGGLLSMVMQRTTTQHQLPFGPYLAVAGALELLWPHWLIAGMG